MHGGQCSGRPRCQWGCVHAKMSAVRDPPKKKEKKKVKYTHRETRDVKWFSLQVLQLDKQAHSNAYPWMYIMNMVINILVSSHKRVRKRKLFYQGKKKKKNLGHPPQKYTYSRDNAHTHTPVALHTHTFHLEALFIQLSKLLSKHRHSQKTNPNLQQ